MQNEELLAVGLTKSQANAYIALLKEGPNTPAALAKRIGETRTNTYAILDKLVKLKLATINQSSKKIYKATSPLNLSELLKQRRTKILDQETMVESIMPRLMSMYLANQEPGVRFFRGKEDLKKIYKEQLDSKRQIYFFKSYADLEYFGFDYLNKIRLETAKYGVKRYGITPDMRANPSKKADKLSNLDRTWVNLKDYSSKVEWTIFGDKVSAVSFGKEGVGIIIDSPQIAESMRQIFELAKAGAKARYPKPKYGYKK